MEEGKTCETIQQKIMEVIYKWRESRKLIVVIVAIAILLDNMLLTSVVPIIPAFLLEIRHEQTLGKLQNDQNITTISLPVQEKPIYIHSFRGQARTYDKDGNQIKCTYLDSSDNINKEVDNLSKSDNSSIINDKSSTTTTTTLSPEQKEAQIKEKELREESTEVGVLFASKPVVQALTNPFIGPLTNKIGYSIPMFLGFIILFISTLTFAAGKSFSLLLTARILQGVGSSFTSVAGMGMLADRYTDDEERGNAMAFALGGLALGVLIGPPFGGFMYEYVGKASPFLALAVLALFDGCLQLFCLQPKVQPEPQKGTSFLTLIKDPYVVLAASAITVANLGIGILEPSLPLWMMQRMDAKNFEQGAAFLPASISYLIGTNLFGPLGYRMGRWLASMIALFAIGFALLSIPMAESFADLILPNSVIGFAIGMVDSSMMPMLGYLVDIRHTSTYGNVYAIGDVAFCVGFIMGPLLSGTIVRWLGFEWLVTLTAMVCFSFAPFMFILRCPPNTNESQSLMTDASVKYVNYTEDLTPDEDGVIKRKENISRVP